MRIHFVPHNGHDVIVLVFISIVIIEAKDYDITVVNLSSGPFNKVSCWIIFTFTNELFVLEFKSYGGLLVVFSNKELNAVSVISYNL